MADPLDDLYAAPLDEFTPRRTELARELKAAGDKAGAADLAKRRKPSVAAWALNQLARQQPDDIAALARLAAELATAQESAMGGAGGDELRRLMRERRDLVGRLAGAAAAILRESGRTADTHASDIASTLEAASVDSRVAADLAAGHLVQAAEPTGFGDWSPVERAEPEAQGAEVDEEAARAARQAKKEAEKALAAAERDVQAAERERDKRQEKVDQAQAALDEAEREVAEARLAAADAKSALDNLP